jgi:hypothetical protein
MLDLFGGKVLSITKVNILLIREVDVLSVALESFNFLKTSNFYHDY